MTKFLELIGVHHCLTLAYSKEENAIIERMNKEVNRHLRALTSQSLPFVQRILKSNHSDRLKISAFQLLLGNVLNIDGGMFLPVAERLNAESQPVSRYMSKQSSFT